MSVFTPAISCLTTSNLLWFTDLTFQVPTQYSLQYWTTFTTRHIHNWVMFPLEPRLFILSGAVSPLLPSTSLPILPRCTGHLPTWRAYLQGSYLFAFSLCSWGSRGKNTEVVCRSLLQWSTFCQALSSRDTPFSCSTWPGDMPGTPLLPPLVLLEHIDLHRPPAVSQHAA